MTKKTASPRRLALPSPDSDDPRLGYEIRYLELTARGLRACRQLGVRTVLDFLQRDREEFTRLRNCGDRTYDDLAHRVRDFLSSQRDTSSCPAADDLGRPIRGLLDNPRAERAFLSLGITTIGEFLDTPRETLLGVKGFGERTYWLVAQRIRQIVESDGLSLLPQSLLAYEIRALHLESRLTEALERRGIAQIGDLLRVPIARLRDVSTIGTRGIGEIGTALDRLIHIGVDRGLDVDALQPEFDFEGTISEILALLEDDQRALFIQRIGLGGTVRSLSDVAARMGIDLAAARILEETTRATLRDQAPSFVNRVQGEAHREFRAFDGVILSDKLAQGSLLHRAAVATRDPLLPLRLVRFLLAGEFFLYGDILSTLRAPTIRRLCAEVRSCCARRRLPLPVRDLTDHLRDIVDPVPLGLVMHFVRNHGHLRIQIDPILGDVIQPGELSVAERLHAILAEVAQPTPLEDLLFLYRELYRTGEMHPLLDHLRKDRRFLEVGRSLWSLRAEHRAELALAELEAEEVVAEMKAEGERKNLLDPHSFAGIPERKIYMILACLRKDHRVRHLGQGLFCLAGKKSEVLQDIRHSMQRAMGEIVTSRFLDNQPRHRRRLAECILHENRALIETAPDRVDLLSNYPFDESRLARLFELIALELGTGRGYATALELLEVIRDTDLAGEWFTPHMLFDLLRRRTHFELLPDHIVANPELGLGGWIQHRIRECLRDARRPMSVEQIVSETPDLGAFAGCVAELALLDPMLQSADDLHFAIV
jgi:hypothetical protein